MNYYQVSLDSEPKTIGVNNGIYQVAIDRPKIIKGKNFDKFCNFFKYRKEFWYEQDKGFILEPPVIEGELLKKAILTDIMGYTPSFTYLDYIYSEKFIKILEEFEIGNYKLFDCKIKNVSTLYYFLFVEKIIREKINFKESIIYTGHKIMNNVKYYKINDLDSYLEFIDENPLSNFETVSIPKSYSKRDIIYIQAVLPNFYSERLIEKLLKENITGLDIKYKNSVKLHFY